MMKYLTGEVIIGFVIIIFGTASYIIAGNFEVEAVGVGPAFFPRLMSGMLIFLSIILILNSVLKIYSTTAPPPEAKEEEIVVTTKAVRKIIACIAGLFVYWWVMYYLGYIGPTIVFLVFMMLLLGERNPIKIGCWSIGLPMLLYTVFEKILNVPLPYVNLRF